MQAATGFALKSMMGATHAAQGDTIKAANIVSSKHRSHLDDSPDEQAKEWLQSTVIRIPLRREETV
jgi:hypothetical protein